jgi:hypothetical protein
MHSLSRSIVATFCALFTTACANYDFATARLPNGELDHARLIADLRASGADELHQGLWIPLLYMDLTSFEPSKPGLPPGYTLTAMRGYGPIFSFGSYDRVAVDPEGAWLDTQDSGWLVWGLLHYDHKDWCRTPDGRRLRHEERWLLFGGDDIMYGTTPGAP